LPLAGGTALRTLESLGALDGRTVLVHGASGGVGSFAVQNAAWAGARVIGTASERNHDYLRGLGAEPVTCGPGLADRGLEAARGAGGTHASVADPAAAEHGGRYLWVRPDGAGTAGLGRLADEGQLTVDVAGTYGLDEVPQAFKASAAGHVRGKLVIVP